MDILLLLLLSLLVMLHTRIRARVITCARIHICIKRWTRLFFIENHFYDGEGRGEVIRFFNIRLHRPIRSIRSRNNITYRPRNTCLY